MSIVSSPRGSVKLRRKGRGLHCWKWLRCEGRSKKREGWQHEWAETFPFSSARQPVAVEMPEGSLCQSPRWPWRCQSDPCGEVKVREGNTWWDLAVVHAGGEPSASSSHKPNNQKQFCRNSKSTEQMPTLIPGID